MMRGLKLYTAKTRGGWGGGGTTLNIFSFVNFSAALYYLNAWRRPFRRQHRCPSRKLVPTYVTDKFIFRLRYLYGSLRRKGKGRGNRLDVCCQLALSSFPLLG